MLFLRWLSVAVSPNDKPTNISCSLTRQDAGNVQIKEGVAVIALAEGETFLSCWRGQLDPPSLASTTFSGSDVSLRLAFAAVFAACR
jgi:hypothetical protein